MKKLLLTAACIVAAVSTLAQGTVNFSNRVLASGVNALVTDSDGVTLLGSSHLAQLYAGADEASLAPFGTAVAFRVNATTQAPLGWFSGGPVTITGISAGGAAVVQVRAWELSGGSTYEAASTSGKKFGKSELLALAGTGNPSAVPPTTPVDLIGLKAFSLVPEPSTIALGLLGAAVLFLRRRQ